MKRILKYVLVVLLLIILYSCNESITGDNQTLMLNTSDDQIVSAVNSFAFDIFHEICKQNPDDNILISPFSISSALSMTYNGSTDSTAMAMKDVLGFDDLNLDEINQCYSKLLDHLTKHVPQIDLDIANAIWMDDDAVIKADFIKTVENYFNSKSFRSDLQQLKNIRAINNWIAEKTGGHIEDLLEEEVDPMTVMFLINAIYYKADWKYQFDPDDTYVGLFITPDNNNVEHSFMRIEEKFDYHYSDFCQSISLPYANESFQMSIHVPNVPSQFNEMQKGFDTNFWHIWLQNKVNTKTKVVLPRLRFHYKDSLDSYLSDLGMTRAFESHNEFKKMADGIWIDEVLHASFIQIDEEGTEAAGATSVEMTKGIQPTVAANQPFIFTIYEKNSGAILFMGRIMKPVWEE